LVDSVESMMMHELANPKGKPMSLPMQTGSQNTEIFISCLRVIPYGQKKLQTLRSRAV